MVHTELLDQLEPLLDGTRISSSTQGTEGMMVGIPLQQDLLAIHEQALLRIHFDGTNTERLPDLVGNIPLIVIKRHFGSI